MLIIHGDNLVESRNYLNSQIAAARKKKQLITRIEVKDLNLTDLIQFTKSNSIFNQDSLIVIFNFFSLLPSNKKTEIIQYLKNNQTLNLILYQDRTIPSPTIRSFNKTQVQYFKQNPIIFNFLESIRPGNSTDTLKWFYQLQSQGESAEMIMAMIIRQIRLLISLSGADNNFQLSPWQKNKLLKQVKFFRPQQLLELHQELYLIDKNLKTGVNPLDLSTQLENFLLGLNYEH